MTTPIIPVRRDLSFYLPTDKISRWHYGGLHCAHFFNSLSIFFPIGERLFMDSVRHYRDRVTDPTLQRDINTFIGQEAMHGREHVEYNQVMLKAGLPVDKYEAVVGRHIGWTRKYLPKRIQLSITIALEHVTAILADLVLRDSALLDQCEPHYAKLWQWHAIEETEHKAVAFDVYQTVFGKGPFAYLLRIIPFLITNLFFWSLVLRFHIGLVASEKQLFNLRGWIAVFNMLWVSPGVLRRIVPHWFDYFKPSFHPWDHDNRNLLRQIDSIQQEAELFEEENTKQGVLAATA